MKVVTCRASDQPLVVEERPLPQPGPGEVLLRIRSCGVCGSELHMGHGPRRDFPGGLVMGHEYAGEVVTLGEGVSGLSEGQLVALYPAVGCGQCPACARGNAILCPSARRLLGGFAEYACIPASAAVPLPRGLGPADGALVEPLAVSFYGAKAAGIRGGERVLVLGAGSIALAAMFWARRMGAGRIVAMSRSPRRAELALAMGADAFITYGYSECEEVVAALGGAPDIVFECVGAEGMLGRAIAHAATFGRVISLGLSRQPESVDALAAGMKDLTLRFPVGYSRADFREVATTMLDGPVDPKCMISRVVPLEDLPQAFADLLGNHGETKVMVDPTLSAGSGYVGVKPW